MNLKTVLLVAGASVALTACGGNGKNSPDEFQVVSRAPLVVPPEAELKPPRPGEPNPQEINPAQQAFEALFPGQTFTPSKPKSRSENDLLSRVGNSDPDIRSDVSSIKRKAIKKTILLADILAADERKFRTDNIEIERVSSGS